MKTSKDVAAEVFAELLRISRESGVVKSAAIDVIAKALDNHADRFSAKSSKGIRPEVIAFARTIETRLGSFTEETGHRHVGVYNQVDKIRLEVDELEKELSEEKPQELIDKAAAVATTAFVIADNADQLESVPILDKSSFSRFYLSGGAELLAQLFHEARQEIVVDPQNRRTWEDTGDTTKKNLIAVCAAVLGALDEETL
jgi:hypothetical protein